MHQMLLDTYINNEQYCLLLCQTSTVPFISYTILCASDVLLIAVIVMPLILQPMNWVPLLFLFYK